MSLVNEALKRVRTQAALQQSAGNPVSHIAVHSHYSEPKKSYVPFVLIGIFACCFVGLVSAAVLHLRKPSNEVASIDRVDPPRANQRAPVVQPRISLPTPPLPATDEEPAVFPEPAPTESSAAVAARVAPATESSPPAEKVPTPAPAPPAPTLVEGKVYLQTVEFPDVPKVRLDGILWSDKAPTALVNGISTSPGDDLGGVTILGIEPKRIKLEAQGKQFYIRLP